MLNVRLIFTRWPILIPILRNYSVHNGLQHCLHVEVCTHAKHTTHFYEVMHPNPNIQGLLCAQWLIYQH